MTGAPDRIARAARYYYDIHRGKQPLPPTPPEIASVSIDEAYQMQEALQALFIPERGAIAGYKIALTTPVMQQLMDVDQSIAGAIFATLVRQSPATLRASDYTRIAVECEIAMRLGTDLPARATPYTKDDVADAVEACLPSIELIEDHGCDQYKLVGARGLIANNAWNVGCVLGAPVANWRALDLAAMTGTMAINGLAVGTGRGGDVMNGHPLHALAWVASTVAARGRPLRRGMIVQTGSVVATQWPKPGDEVSVRFVGLGEASLRLL
ncbi:MAG TPA: fumarylacetoacetate hydrolase family protein [Stellaceae bacterium]|nr:fumarylacetoacetate hydrolase family protein [Stellaceae bacterium]